MPLSEEKETNNPTRGYTGDGRGLSDLFNQEPFYASLNDTSKSVAGWARWQASSNVSALLPHLAPTQSDVESQLARNVATHGLLYRNVMTVLSQTAFTDFATLASSVAFVQQKYTITAPTGMFNQLALYKDYTLRDGNTVSTFLYRHPALDAVLREAPMYIHRLFGDDSPLVLKVSADPGEPGSEHLSLLIQTRLPVNQALDRLENLDAAWWFDASQALDHKMLIDIEPV